MSHNYVRVKNDGSLHCLWIISRWRRFASERSGTGKRFVRCRTPDHDFVVPSRRVPSVSRHIEISQQARIDSKRNMLGLAGNKRDPGEADQALQRFSRA